MRKHWWLTVRTSWPLLAVLSGCAWSPAVVYEGETTLRPGTWNRVETRELRLKGPQADLCLELAGGYGPNVSEPGVLLGGAGGSLAIRARAVAAGSVVDMGPASTRDGGKTSMICFDAPADRRALTFQAIELSPSMAAVLRRVTWWSGTRRKFL